MINYLWVEKKHKNHPTVHTVVPYLLSMKFLKNLLISSVPAFMSANSMCCWCIFRVFLFRFFSTISVYCSLLMLVLFWHILQLICNVVNAFAGVIHRDAVLFIESMDSEHHAAQPTSEYNLRLFVASGYISIISSDVNMNTNSEHYTPTVLYPLHSC